MTRIHMTAIQRRITIARTAAGFETITAGAKAAGVPVSTASQHENVKTPSGRKPKLEAHVRYADAYEVSLDWLINGRGFK